MTESPSPLRMLLFRHTKRREFITLLGGAASWPLAARAQQPAVPVIGFLSSRSPGESASVVAAFRQGLQEAGYQEGQNVHIAFRWAENQHDRLSALAAELVQFRVGVIFAAGGTVTGFAAKTATSTIPIVNIGTDPDRLGLVASLNRPGGNVTGISPLSWTVGTKPLELIRELVPKAAVVGILSNPQVPGAEIESREIHAAAQAIGQQIITLNAANERDIHATFASAGLDGFWIHRALQNEGIESHVVDAASIATSRRRRRAKTDKIDGETLVRALLAYKRGEPRVCAMVKVPTPGEEDRRQGVSGYQPLRRDRRQRLEELQTGDSRAFPQHLKALVNRELDRLELLLKQIKIVEAARDELPYEMAQVATDS
jgi:ABC transporter substrate binding protein